MAAHELHFNLVRTLATAEEGEEVVVTTIAVVASVAIEAAAITITITIVVDTEPTIRDQVSQTELILNVSSVKLSPVSILSGHCIDYIVLNQSCCIY